MNNLILVRHGQSLWNKEKRFTGWADIDLTEQGKFEAEKVIGDVPPVVYKYISEIAASFVKVTGAVGVDIHDSPTPLPLPAFAFTLIEKFLVLNLM